MMIPRILLLSTTLLAASLSVSAHGESLDFNEVEPGDPELNVGDEPIGILQPMQDEVAPIGDEAKLWRLHGGGELIGSMVKETLANVFIDIGPTIVTIPSSSILERRSLADAPEDTRTTAGLGVGVFDEETGSLVFRSRDSGQEMLSQQEMLDRVKKGVVLVTNPGGLGTGWMLDHSGRIMTNHHVTGREPYQTVTVYVKRDGQWERERFDQSKVVAFSSLHDIAIIQLDMEKVRSRGIDLYPLPVADPTSLEAGDRVFAVGNPGMGAMVLDHTISEGVVSSLARNFSDLIYLQTTAAVNPGNSGGPLVNEMGEVVGLVTLKAIFQEGVAFALPSSFIHLFLANIDAYTVTEMSPNQGFRYHRPR